MANTKKWTSDGPRITIACPVVIKDAVMLAALLIDKDDPEMMALLRKRNADRKPLGEFASMA